MVKFAKEYAEQFFSEELVTEQLDLVTKQILKTGITKSPVRAKTMAEEWLLSIRESIF